MSGLLIRRYRLNDRQVIGAPRDPEGAGALAVKIYQRGFLLVRGIVTGEIGRQRGFAGAAFGIYDRYTKHLVTSLFGEYSVTQGHALAKKCSRNCSVWTLFFDLKQSISLAGNFSHCILLQWILSFAHVNFAKVLSIMEDSDKKSPDGVPDKTSPMGNIINEHGEEVPITDDMVSESMTKIKLHSIGTHTGFTKAVSDDMLSDDVLSDLDD